MTKIELEADNIVLISAVERNIKSLESSVGLLRAALPDAGCFYLRTLEVISEAQDDIKRSREFLDRIFNECNYTDLEGNYPK